MADVNQLLCHDTSRTGSFVTLFYLTVDRREKLLQWVRAGHDPAIVYTPATGIFTELKGKGIALGVDENWNFEYNELLLSGDDQVILVASDGAWEVENARGEQFGKDRLKQLLADNSDWSPNMILETITDKIAAFRGNIRQNDDITISIIKIQ